MADLERGRPISLVAIALAGGQSSRMGQDKALLPIQGIPLLRRVCIVAKELTPIVYVVTSRVETYQPIVPEGCQLIQEQCSSQPHGPLIGFAQGLNQIKMPQRRLAPIESDPLLPDWVLLLACDLPFLQVETLRRWLGQLATVPPDAIALLPCGKKGWEPLCGFYRTTCLTSLTQFVQQGGRSFQAWLAEETVEAISLSLSPDENRKEQQMLFNCNTPQDWSMAIEQA